MDFNKIKERLLVIKSYYTDTRITFLTEEFEKPLMLSKIIIYEYGDVNCSMDIFRKGIEVTYDNIVTQEDYDVLINHIKNFKPKYDDYIDYEGDNLDDTQVKYFDSDIWFVPTSGAIKRYKIKKLLYGFR